MFALKVCFKTVHIPYVKFIADSKTNHHHHSNQQQTTLTPSQAHHQMDHTKNSSNEKPYLGQTSLLSTPTSTNIKSEPAFEYSCIQSQSYPYQQLFSFSGATTSNADVAYHHQHHVTAAAKLMASS